MDLTPKQEKFCQEYILTGNKSEAYRRAYSAENMKPETINKRASEMFENGDIRGRIENLQKDIAERNEITIDEVVGILTKLARFDIADLYDENNKLKSIHEINEDARLNLEGVESDEHIVDGTVKSVIKKVKTGSRRQALEMLMKHLGGYEKDNSQKKPEVTQINYSKLSDKALEEIANAGE